MSLKELVPYLSVSNASQAIEFYSQVFECDPNVLLKMPDGRIMHCEYNLGGARLFLSEELPEHGGTPSPATLGSTTVAIHLYVPNCDATVTRMETHGAKVLDAPQDLFWGERFARVRDPFGHEWGIATRLREMSPDEIQAAANKLFDASN